MSRVSLVKIETSALLAITNKAVVIRRVEVINQIETLMVTEMVVARVATVVAIATNVASPRVAMSTSPTPASSSRSRAFWICAMMATASCARTVISRAPRTATWRSLPFASMRFVRVTPSPVRFVPRHQMRSTPRCIALTPFRALTPNLPVTVLASKT